MKSSQIPGKSQTIKKETGYLNPDSIWNRTGTIGAFMKERLEGFAERIDRNLTILVVGFFVVFYAIIMFRLFSSDYYPEVDVYVFYDYAINIHEGLIPYKDFVVEFPPLSLIMFYAPSIISTDFNIYFAVYSLLNIIAAILTFYIGLKILPDNSKVKLAYTVTFILIMVIYGQYMIAKHDMPVVALTAFGIYFFSRKKYVAGYGLVMMGALMKIYPAMLLPLFFFINLLNRKDDDRVKNAFSGVAISIAILAVSFLPFVIMGASLEQTLAWVSFHEDRGFQVESTIGIIVQFLSDIGIGEYTLIPNHYTEDVISPITDALSPGWLYVLCAAIIIVMGLGIANVIKRDFKDDNDRTMVIFVSSLALILTFMLLNKVFSTQYLLWLLPLFIVIPAFNFKPKMTIMIILLLFIFILSNARFLDPVMFHTLFVIRDILLFTVLFFLLRYLVNRLRSDPSEDS